FRWPAATRPPWRSASSAARSRMLRAMDSSCMPLPSHAFDLHVPPQVGAEVVPRQGAQPDREQPPDHDAGGEPIAPPLGRVVAALPLLALPADGAGLILGCHSRHVLTSFSGLMVSPLGSMASPRSSRP